MRITGLNAYDNTLNKTALLLNDIMETMQCQDHSASCAVLHVLRDELTRKKRFTNTKTDTLRTNHLSLAIRRNFWHMLCNNCPRLRLQSLKRIISEVFDELSKQMPNDEIKQGKKIVTRRHTRTLGFAEISQAELRIIL